MSGLRLCPRRTGSTGSSVLTSFNIDENIQLTKLVASGNSLVTGVNVSTLTALTHLDLNACGLTALDVDSNVVLEYFDCSSNKLTALNVNNNVALAMFDCSDNQLSTIRVVNNTALDKLDLSKNNLLNVNVRSNTVLKILNVSDNAGIAALALGYNKVLETLEASNTALTDIDLSKNLEMKNLNLAGCSSMHILDVTKNVALETLDVSLLVRLIVSKGLNSSIYKVGQYVSIDDDLGVVFYNTDAVVKIVSKGETTKTWSAAMTWCTAKGAAWYLPDLNELTAVYNNKAKLNATLSSPSVITFSAVAVRLPN